VVTIVGEALIPEEIATEEAHEQVSEEAMEDHEKDHVTRSAIFARSLAAGRRSTLPTSVDKHMIYSSKNRSTRIPLKHTTRAS
jgi:hypothetical protein